MNCMHCDGTMIRTNYTKAARWVCIKCNRPLCTGRDPHVPAKKNPNPSEKSGTAANGVVDYSGKGGRL